MKIGFLGLGKMGQRMVEKLILDRHEVIAWNRTFEIAEKFQKELKVKNYELKIARTIENLIESINTSPRIIWLMLPAGETTKSILNELTPFLKAGDIIINGANENPKNSQMLNDQLQRLNIKYLGIGVSGGVNGLENGFSLMAGGDKEAYEIVTPILKSLSKPNAAFDYFGESGAGHFIKMVHNGIEYGMMQSIAEGLAVVEKSEYKFDLAKIAKLWQKGTIISSFLIDLIAQQLQKDKTLGKFEGPVSESGEAKWTIKQAHEERIDIAVIEQSLNYRLETQKDTTKQKNFTTRVLNALRFAFGGHQVKLH